MYQALYRSWRPTRFADIVGQQAIVRTLLNQIKSGRISHAYLFCGSRGTGKTSTAKTFARALNCLDPHDGEPCGECAACRDEQTGASMDVLEIDAASNNGVDEIRDLRDKIMYPPAIGKYRVYIIDEVHMLSAGAFNALLKTLEEPPAHAVFILATTEPQKLPATILSRCQRFDFHRIRAEVIVEHLRHILDTMNISAAPEALEQIALAAEGGMRDALSILDMCISYAQGSVDEGVVSQVLGTSGRAFMFEFADALLEENAAGALELTDRMMREGRDVQVFLREIIAHLRALMMVQIVGDDAANLLEITGEDAQRMSEQAGKASPERLMSVMDIFLDAERDSRYVSHGRVLLEMAITRVCRRGKVEDISGLLTRLDQLEKQIASGAVAAPADKPARAAKSAPAAQPRPKPAPVNGDDAAKYKAAMDMVKKSAMDIFAIARRGEFRQVRGDDVIAEFAPAAAAFADIMNQPKNADRMSGFLTDCFGREVHYKAMIQAVEPPRAQAGDLGPIYDAFGRENVQVIDDQ